MKYQFGITSKQNLATCRLDLQWIMREALAIGLIDFSVTEGHRSESRQDSLYPKSSKVKWPNSKHNKTPSDAFDAVPYVNGKASYKYQHCIFLAGIILTCAKKLGFEIRWGGNWDMDGEPVTDQDFQDLVHYERVK